jgi:hypothetical protein
VTSIGMEQLGFYYHTWAALRARPWTTPRAGLRASPCAEPGRYALCREPHLANPDAIAPLAGGVA